MLGMQLSIGCLAQDEGNQALECCLKHTLSTLRAEINTFCCICVPPICVITEASGNFNM